MATPEHTASAVAADTGG